MRVDHLFLFNFTSSLKYLFMDLILGFSMYNFKYIDVFSLIANSKFNYVRSDIF